MTVSVVSVAECRALAVSTLGLREPAGLFSAEGLAASLRRAASFLCPATPRQIVDSVLDALRPLRPEEPLPRDDLSELIDVLISTGDVLELKQSGESNRLLYLGPPSYIEKQPGRYLVLGIRPFGAPLISSALAGTIRYEGHTRTIDLDPVNAGSQFSVLGLHKVRRDQWVPQPPEVRPVHLVSQLQQRLAVAGPAGEVEDLMILDPAMKVTYYKAS